MRQKSRRRLSIILTILLLGGGYLGFKHIIKAKSIEEAKTEEISEGVQALEKLESKNVSDIQNKMDNMNKNDDVNSKQEESGSLKEVFDSTVFMGDSLTESLSFYDILNDSSVIGIKGRSVITAIRNDVTTVKNLNPEKIVMMYGMNDLFIVKNSNAFVEKYEVLIKDVKKELPNTEIYVNAIFPVKEKAIKRKKKFANIDEFNNDLKEMCNKLGIKFIDSRSSVTDNMYEPDGIHMKKSFYTPWLKAIQGKIGL